MCLPDRRGRRVRGRARGVHPAARAAARRTRDGVRPHPAPGPHAPSFLSEALAQGDRRCRSVRPRTACAWSPTTSTSSRRTLTSRSRDGCLTPGAPQRATSRKPHLPIDFFLRALADEPRQPRDRRGPVGDGLGRDRGLAGHQGRERHHLRAGSPVGEVRRHAAQRGRRRRRRLQPADSRARPGAGAPEPPPVPRRGARCDPRANDDTALARIFAHRARRVVGVDFSEYKAPTFERRLARRMALRRVDDLHDYLTLLAAMTRTRFERSTRTSSSTSPRSSGTRRSSRR